MPGSGLTFLVGLVLGLLFLLFWFVLPAGLPFLFVLSLVWLGVVWLASSAYYAERSGGRQFRRDWNQLS